MLLDIHLGKNADFTLTFEFYQNAVSAAFYERFVQQENKVISRTQFYNFGETAQDVEQHLKNIISQIKAISPDLLSDDDVNNLNLLHVNFPEYQKNATGELLSLMRDFNYSIHHLENKNQNTNSPAFLFACEDPGVQLPVSAYEMFTVSKKFGELYMPYPHVGKHLFELFLDNDIDVPNDHIVCTNKMCNGAYVWLGDNRYLENHTKLMRRIFSFYSKVQHKMPFAWGDPRLALGYLPLATLVSDLSKQEVIEQVSHNKFVHSWTLR